MGRHQPRHRVHQPAGRELRNQPDRAAAGPGALRAHPGGRGQGRCTGGKNEATLHRRLLVSDHRTRRPLAGLQKPCHPRTTRAAAMPWNAACSGIAAAPTLVLAAAMRHLLLINPNTSLATTQRLVQTLQPRLPADVQLAVRTATFGARYIACEASHAVAGAAVLQSWAEQVAESTNAAGRRADRLLRRPGAVRAARVQCVPGHRPRRGLVHRSGAAWPLCHRHRRAALETDAAAAGREPGLRRQVVARRDRRTHRRRDAGRLRHGAATPGAGLPRCGAPRSGVRSSSGRRPGRLRAGLAGAGGPAADRQCSRRPDGAAGAQRPAAATRAPTASSPTGAASRRRCRGSGLRRGIPVAGARARSQRPPSRFATSWPNRIDRHARYLPGRAARPRALRLQRHHRPARLPLARRRGAGRLCGAEPRALRFR